MSDMSGIQLYVCLNASYTSRLSLKASYTSTLSLKASCTSCEGDAMSLMSAIKLFVS
jgi:hypothetical protein